MLIHQLRVIPQTLEWAMQRSGNPRLARFSYQPEEAVTTRSRKLGSAKAGSGHDSYLKGCIVLCDLYVTQIVHRQLLRYNHIDVVSAMSLMANTQGILEDNICMERISPEVREQLIRLAQRNELRPEDIPMGVLTGISFVTNYLQLKTIYAQRKTHKLDDWVKFCNAIAGLPMFLQLTGSAYADS